MFYWCENLFISLCYCDSTCIQVYMLFANQKFKFSLFECSENSENLKNVIYGIYPVSNSVFIKILKYHVSWTNYVNMVQIIPCVKRCSKIKQVLQLDITCTVFTGIHLFAYGW